MDNTDCSVKYIDDNDSFSDSDDLRYHHSDMVWFEKYRPTKLEDIAISQQKVDFLLKWFSDFKDGTSEYRALLFIGPPGLGKTTVAHVMLEKAGYHVKEFNASDIRSKKLINLTLDNLMNMKNVLQISKDNALPIAIIMDEVDGMCKGDRGGLEELLSFIPGKRKKQMGSSNTKIPIICICNTGNIKLEMIKQLKTKCTEITFALPDHAVMMDIFIKIANSENLSFDADTTADEIIKYSQSDFRRMITILEYLVNRYGTYITSNNVQESYDVLCQKEQDLHITDNVRKLINYEMSYNNIMNIYNRDKSKAPMVIHENYIKSIRAQTVDAFSKLDNAINCINSIVESDIVEKTIYNTQGWHLQTVQGISCAYIPNYYMNKEKKNTVVSAKWTNILPTNSHSQHLQKKVHELIFVINRKYSYSVTDVQFLCNLILHCMKSNQVETAVKLILNYGLISDEDIQNKKKKLILIVGNLMKYIKLNGEADKWVSNSELELQFNRAIEKFKTIQVVEKKHATRKLVTKKTKIEPKIKPSQDVALAANIEKSTILKQSMNNVMDTPTTESDKSVCNLSTWKVKKLQPQKTQIEIKAKNKAEQTVLASNRKTIIIKKSGL